MGLFCGALGLLATAACKPCLSIATSSDRLGDGHTKCPCVSRTAHRLLAHTRCCGRGAPPYDKSSGTTPCSARIRWQPGACGVFQGPSTQNTVHPRHCSATARSTAPWGEPLPRSIPEQQEPCACVTPHPTYHLCTMAWTTCYQRARVWPSPS